jgi:PTS system galactosamine-specific IID component
MASDNSEIKKVLTKQDITKLGVRSMFLQASFNYERMQAGGFLFSQLPTLKKLYKDDKKGLSDAMQDNLEFINTHPNLVGFLMGLLISLEEAKENRSTIKGLKVALFAPLAGIGDAIFWFTILPIIAGIASSMAISGSAVGPAIFFGFYVVVFLLRIVWTHLGYNLGTKAISTIRDASTMISKAATVLGCTVIGGLIASYVHITLLPEIVVNEAKTVNIQADFLDKIFPNILPCGYVFLLYYLLKHKKMSPVILIVSTFILSIVLSFFGVL